MTDHNKSPIFYQSMGKMFRVAGIFPSKIYTSVTESVNKFLEENPNTGVMAEIDDMVIVCENNPTED